MEDSIKIMKQVSQDEYDTLRDREFNHLVDSYMLGTIRADDYAKLNNIQNAVIQTIKRSLKRLASKDL